MADACTALHCDFFSHFVSGHMGYGFGADAPCREAVVKRHRQLCEVRRRQVQVHARLATSGTATVISWCNDNALDLLLYRRSQTPAFRCITAAQPASFTVSYKRPVCRMCMQMIEAPDERQQKGKRLMITAGLADYVMHSLCKAHTCHLATHRQMLHKIVKV